VSNRPKRQVPSNSKVTAAAATGSGRTPVWIWVVIGVVVLAAAALAVALTSGDDGKVTTSSGEEVEAIVFGEPALQSEALPELPQGGADPAVGLLAPAVEGQDLAGEPIAIPGAGRPKVVMFLAHWCPHCQAEVPRIGDWVADNGLPEDVDVVSVATATDETKPNYPPGAWLQGEGWPIDVLVDDQQGTAAIGYGLTGFPFFVAVDAEGNVVQRASGELSVQQWEALLDAARTGEPSPALATGPSSPG
jgi:thiol-disulfide isomerase/thioredoxin